MKQIKFMMILMVVGMLVGCSSETTFYVKCYKADHDQTMYVYDESGGLIKSKTVKECEMVNTSDRQEHKATTRFTVDGNIQTVIIESPHYKRKSYGIYDGAIIGGH